MKHIVLAIMAAATLSTQAVAQTKAKVSQVYTESARLNVTNLKTAEQPVQLNRYLFAGYNTICLPMSMSAEQLSEVAGDVRIERFAGMKQEGTTLNLYFVDCTSEGIEAGQPYLIYSPKAQYLRVRSNEAQRIGTELQAVRMSDNAGNTIVFGSSWESMTKEGRYGIPAKQDVYPLESVLVRTEADKTFLPTRCGFDWESQSATATELCIRHIQSLDEVTGISTTGNGNWSVDNVIYDLNGRRITTAQKGINIVNGKKVVK